jgi:DNA-binding response OmpR family regulator
LLKKPFDEAELLCRVGVIVRRNSEHADNRPASQTLHIGRYRFEAARQELCMGQQVVRLTEKENSDYFHLHLY